MIQKIKKPEVIFLFFIFFILVCNTVMGVVGDYMEKLVAQMPPSKKVLQVNVEDGGQESCLESETFHPENRLCYLDDGSAEEPFIEMMIGAEYDSGSFWGVGDTFTGDAYNNVYELVEYEVDGNVILSPRKKNVRKDLLDERENIELQQEVWDLFAAMIPVEDREYLTHYIVLTDGLGSRRAVVKRSREHSIEWVLGVDISDTKNLESLAYSFIHEYGYLFILDFRQVPPYIDENACTTYHIRKWGCVNSSSYLYFFYNMFWHDAYNDWSEPPYFQDDEYYRMRSKFYSNHSTDFATEYAAASPVEDIVESWVLFVTKPKPAGNTIAEQKILFFYQFPELIDLRQEIIARTYSRLIRMPYK